MTMVYFRYTFAESGDKTAIPEATQPSGTMSYQEGYSADYELNPDTDPDGKFIDRRTFNQLMSDVTSAIKQYQTFGAPEWITSVQNGGTPYPYSQGARCAYRASGGDPWVLYESLTNANTDTPGATANWLVISVSSVVASFGECQLVVDGSNLRLNPKDGNALSINGDAYTIPSAGVALSASGASANTSYNIYAYMSSGVMTLERSLTATATDSVTGMTIKNGDPTRTFVGVGVTNGSSAWYLTISQFNRAMANIGTNGYRVNPDGTIEQWGTSGTIGIEGYVDVTYPVKFPTATLNVNATVIGTAGGGVSSVYIDTGNTTATGTRIYNDTSGGGGDVTAFWRAIGH